jgi:phage terminase small subunit
VKLNARQQKFVEVYNGNATEAAKIAGYTGADDSLAVTGSRLLNDPAVAAAIAARNKKVVGRKIASRLDRQEFWTEVMFDVGAEMRDRLKASELLGRSEADFTDKIEVSENFADSLKKALNRKGL